MKTRGVTFWEVLAVLVIVAVTAAILFPVFAKARTRGGPSCASNQKQLWLGVLQYAQDNDENYPNISDKPGSTNTWRSAIFPYVKSKRPYQCRDKQDEDIAPDGFNRSYAANYSGNYSGSLADQGQGAFAGPGSLPINIGDLTTPSTLIMLCEINRSNAPEFNIDDATRFGPAKHVLWAGHTGGGNYCFADGHVKYLKPNSTNYDAADRKGYMRHWTLWYRDGTKRLSSAGIAILAEAEKRGADRP